MRLICPVNFSNRLFVEAEITDPGGGVIADTNKIIENNGNVFFALLTFAKGNIVSLKTDTGEVEEKKETISQICRNMTYKTIEHLAIQQVLLYNEDDKVEGIYRCPRCNEKIYAEKTKEDDTRDCIGDLNIVYQEDNKEFSINFDNILEIKNAKGEVIESIQSMSFNHPSIDSYIDAYNKYPTDSIRLQYKVYENSITRVNSNPITTDWKTKFSKLFFEQQKNRELNKIAKIVNKAGIDGLIYKTCNQCGKEFEVYLNTANFFVSALQ